jgi:CO dehydrogenase/acetyl-CoA synthase alpha subunit
MIIAPALIEAISGMADKAGVKYTRESTDIDEEAPMGSEIALTLTKMREGKDMPKEAPVEKVVEEVTEEEPTGLMARRR